MENRDTATDKVASDLLKASASITQEAPGIPDTEDDLKFLLAVSDRAVVDRLVHVSTHMIQTVNRLSRAARVVCENTRESTIVENSIEGVEDSFGSIVHNLDALFEKIDVTLDERRGMAPPQADFSAVPVSFTTGGGGQEPGRENEEQFRIHHSSMIPRPQYTFYPKIDNFSPFIPVLPEKYNASVGLQDFYLENTPSDVKGRMKDGIAFLNYPHPYEYELGNFQIPEAQLDVVPAPEKKDIEKTELFWIEDGNELKTLVDNMISANVVEIAMDVVQHSYRSFQGFSCLIQLSTREADYIIDCLKCRNHVNYINNILTRPNVVKVMHESAESLQWLQRDFSVFVVGLFDTLVAAKMLPLENHDLPNLLETLCGVPQKNTQSIVDWRIRPVPMELIDFARRKTHHLLPLYDILRVELGKRSSDNFNIARSAFKQSNELCLQRYFAPTFDQNGHVQVYGQFEAAKKIREFSNVQWKVLEALYQWRDTVARDEDESASYVMPNRILLKIAENLPQNLESLSTLLRSDVYPPLVKKFSSDVVQVILGSVKAYGFSPKNLQATSEKEGNTSEAKVSSNRSLPELFTMINWIGEPDIYESRSEASSDESFSLSDLNYQRGSAIAEMLFSGEKDDNIEAREELKKLELAIESYFFEPKFSESGELIDSAVDITFGGSDGITTPPEIPKSMDDIFKLSNINRNKNREKRKLRQQSHTNGRVDGPQSIARPGDVGEFLNEVWPSDPNQAQEPKPSWRKRGKKHPGQARAGHRRTKSAGVQRYDFRTAAAGSFQPDLAMSEDQFGGSRRYGKKQPRKH